MAVLQKVFLKFFKFKYGFTLVEVMIASSIAFLVMLGVASLQYISARTIKELYAPTRSRSVRMIALNEIRLRLCDAKIGSCIVSDLNHRIRFEDPNLKVNGVSVTSEFYFDKLHRTLYYDANISESNPQVLVKGPIEVTFIKGCRDLDLDYHSVYLGTDSVVTLYVQTSSELSYSNVDLRDGETVVYLRNP